MIKLLIFLLIYYSGFAFALPHPSVEVKETWKIGSFTGSSRNEVCARFISSINGADGKPSYNGGHAKDDGCYGYPSSGGPVYGPLEYPFLIDTSEKKVCDPPTANSIVSGSICVCKSGFLEKNNICVADSVSSPVNIDNLIDYLNKNDICYSFSGSNFVRGVCLSGVVLDGGAGVIIPQSKSTTVCGKWSKSSDQSVSKCKSLPNDPKGVPNNAPGGSGDLPKCGVGQNPQNSDGSPACTNAVANDWSKLPTCIPGQSSVSGSDIVCRHSSDTNLVKSNQTSKTKTIINSDGTTRTVKEVTSVDCSGSKCITTTSTIPIVSVGGGDGSEGTNSEPTETPKDDFCLQNPQLDICKNSAFSGACGGSFSCDGDAVQCAIAKEVHQRNCQLWEKDPDDNLYEKAMRGEDEGNPQKMRDSASSSPVNLPSSFDFSGKGWDRSCPADPVIPLGFATGEITLPFSALCGPLGVASDVAVLLTALACMVWVVGGKVGG